MLGASPSQYRKVGAHPGAIGERGKEKAGHLKVPVLRWRSLPNFWRNVSGVCRAMGTLYRRFSH